MSASSACGVIIYFDTASCASDCCSFLWMDEIKGFLQSEVSPDGSGREMEISMLLKETTQAFPKVIIAFAVSVDKEGVINRVCMRSNVTHIR